MTKSATSIYLTINPKGDCFKNVFSKVFFTATEYNAFVKDESFQEKYPAALYNIIKEVY